MGFGIVFTDVTLLLFVEKNVCCLVWLAFGAYFLLGFRAVLVPVLDKALVVAMVRTDVHE